MACGRDENGWRVPRAGTKSRAIYELARSGMKRSKIVEELGLNDSSAGVLLHRIKRPEHANATARKRNK